jgi:hypothetical protein
MSEPITIRKFSKKEVADGIDTRFNVNNLWTDNDEQQPDDYYDVLKRTQTKYWLPVLKPNYVHHLDLDKEDTEWMLQALNSYVVMVMMGTDELQSATVVTRLYKEQLDKTVAKHAKEFPAGSWFVRVERVSLKSGIHGVGPYDNIKNIIRSIITSKLGHECISIDDDLERFRIYLFPWVTIQHEFRAFVHQNKITAISTQHYTEIDKQLADKTDDELKANIVDKIAGYFNENLRDRLSHIVGPDYTIDIAILEDGSVYFIEPNCFGANYAAGSSLFHWSTDHNVLCSMNGIEFRFVDKE